MLNKSGRCVCNHCGKELETQRWRIDVYQRRLGKILIYEHYCEECFQRMKSDFCLDGDSATGVRYSQQLLRDTFQKFRRKDGLVQVSKLYKELML